MKFISIKTEILNSSLKFNEDNTQVTFQANANIQVEGCPYPELYTQHTIFDLVCNVSDIANIQAIAEQQVNAYIANKYPEI